MTVQPDLSILHKPLPQEEFLVRSWNCFQESNPHTGARPLKTWYDLATQSEQEMLRRHGYGRKTLADDKKILAKHGLEFGMTDLPPPAADDQAIVAGPPVEPELPGVMEIPDYARDDEGTAARSDTTAFEYQLLWKYLPEAVDAFRDVFLRRRGEEVPFRVMGSDGGIGAVDITARVTQLAFATWMENVLDSGGKAILEGHFLKFDKELRVTLFCSCGTQDTGDTITVYVPVPAAST